MLIFFQCSNIDITLIKFKCDLVAERHSLCSVVASNAINYCDEASSHRATQPSDVHLMHPIPGTDQSLFQLFRGVLGYGTWPASNLCPTDARSG